MGIVFKNNAKTTLASSLSNSATSATVTDGSVFPSLSAGEFFLLTFDDGTNNEICKCTARSGNTLTIVRAQESTTARAFSSGDAAEGRVTAGVLETIQENIAAKSANQTVYNTTTASSATDYDIGIDPSVEANAMVFLNGVMQHHDTFSFSGSTLTFDAAPPNGMALEVIVDNLINLQSSNLTVDTFTATSGQTDFVLSDTPAAETNLIVFVDGVFQDQDSYTISNNTLTITDGVVLNRGVTVYVINPVNIGTPSDGTVTSAKLSGNITMPGTLTVGSNDVAFDSPTFVVDNANSRVGLGTASPSVPVDIVGDVKMSANLTVDTSTLVVDATNNRVGIGTNSPQETLHLFNSAQTWDQYANIRMSTESDSYAAEIGFHRGTSNDSDRGLFLSGDGTNKHVRVLHGGNVGIGNSSPLGKLTISNAAGNNAPNTITAANTYLQLGSDDYGPNNDGKFMIGFGYTDATNTHSPAYIGFEEETSSGDTAGQLTFYTRGVITDTAPTQRMVIGATGKVQIWHGGTAYYTSFEDNNEINTYTSAGANSTMYLQHPGGDLEVSAGVFFVDRSASSVGINTTSPDKQLHIKNTSTGDTGIVIENTNNAQNLDIDFYNNAGSAQGRIRYAEGAGSFGFAPNVSADDALHILYNGDIGFGTSTPFSYGGQNFEFKDTSSNQTGVRVTSAASSFEVGTDTNGGYLQAITPGDGISFYSANSSAADVQAMTINSTGIVTTPQNPAFRAYLSTEQTSNGVVTTGFTDSNTTASRAYDRSGNFNTSNGRFTAPVDGVYVFSIMWDSLSSQAGFDFLINGTSHVRWEPTGLSNDAWESKAYSTHAKLATNDYVQLQIVHASGTNPVHQGSGIWGHFAGALIG